MPADAARLVAMVTPQLAELELRQQLLRERFGPVAALVLERVLTAAERRRRAAAAAPAAPGLSAPAGSVGTSRGARTG